jgi:hypothetical protein
MSSNQFFSKKNMERMFSHSKKKEEGREKKASSGFE